MCDCDCELPKRERWALVKREQASELAGRLRRRARTIAMLRSEEARLTAEGLRLGADMIDPQKKKKTT